MLAGRIFENSSSLTAETIFVFSLPFTYMVNFTILSNVIFASSRIADIFENTSLVCFSTSPIWSRIQSLFCGSCPVIKRIFHSFTQEISIHWLYAFAGIFRDLGLIGIFFINYPPNLNNIISPSWTIYSFPSIFTFPFSLAHAHPPCSMRSFQFTVSALINFFWKSVCMTPAASGAVHHF